MEVFTKGTHDIPHTTPRWPQSGLWKRSHEKNPKQRPYNEHTPMQRPITNVQYSCSHVLKYTINTHIDTYPSQPPPHTHAHTPAIVIYYKVTMQVEVITKVMSYLDITNQVKERHASLVPKGHFARRGLGGGVAHINHK